MNESAWRKRRLVTLGLLVTLGVAALIVLFAFVRPPMRPAGYATGDDLDIRLVAVWPEEGLSVFDAAGEKTGETLGTGRWPRPASRQTRYVSLIIEAPVSVERELLFVNTEIRPDGRRGTGFACFSPEPVRLRGDSRVYHLRSHIQPTYMRSLIPGLPTFGFLTRRQETEKVDLVLTYWHGPRGDAAYTFEGPFEAGKDFPADDGGKAVLSVERYYGLGSQWGTWFTFSAEDEAPSTARVLAYDVSGRRHYANRKGGSMKRGKVAFAVNNLKPEEVTAVTIGESPRVKTFHDIKVVHPAGIEPSLWGYRTTLADRQDVEGLREQDLWSYHFESPDEALKAIDVVRGGAIRQAYWRLMPDLQRPGSGGTHFEGNESLKEVFSSWADADDPQIRLAGIHLGLETSFNDFAGLALDALEEDLPQSAHTLRWPLVNYGDRLSAEHIRRLKEMLLDQRGPKLNRYCLVLIVLANGSPEATAALVDFARSDKPSLWWPALAESRIREALGPVEEWPETLRARGLIASGFTLSDVDNERTRAAAISLLPGLITPQLYRNDAKVFDSIFNSAMTLCDRETAVGAIIDFLSSPDAGDSRGLVIGRMVKYLNLWHGANVASLGSDLDEDVPLLHTRNWRQVADDALFWRETGEMRLSLPEGYRATRDDLRVIFKRKGEPPTGAISLWSPSPHTDSAAREHYLECAGSFFSYSIEPELPRGGRAQPGQPPPEYRFSCRMKVIEDKSSPRFGPVGFSMSSLPLSVLSDPNFVWEVVIERADCRQSVLSGTTVFDDWWEKYGPVEKEAPTP